MNRQKVCFLTNQYAPKWSGVARSAVRTVSYLQQEGMEVHIIIPSSMPAQQSSQQACKTNFKDIVENPEMDESGAYIYRLHVGNTSVMMANLIEFIQLLDYRTHFDIFHGFWLPLAYPSLMVASKGNRPVIGSIRGNDAAKAMGLSSKLPFITSVLKSSTWITSVSSDLISSACAIEDFSDRSSVIFNGIDTTDFPRWRIEDCVEGRVGTAGELRYKKGIPYLIEAYGRLPRKLRTELFLGGPFSDKSEQYAVTKAIKMQKIEAETIYTGFLGRKEILDSLCSLNVFVVCSLHDGLPNTLLEAAGCGVPIVASKVAGMEDVLTDGRDCLFVEPADSEGTKNAIRNILEDQSLANKLSAGALELAKRLDHQQEKASWIELYSLLLARKSISRAIPIDKNKLKLA